MKQKYPSVVKLFGRRWHHGTPKARESCCGSCLWSVVDLSRALDQPFLYNVTTFAWFSVGEDPYMLHLSGTCKGNACLIIVPHASTYAYLAHPTRALLGYNAPYIFPSYALACNGDDLEISRRSFEVKFEYSEDLVAVCPLAHYSHLW